MYVGEWRYKARLRSGPRSEMKSSVGHRNWLVHKPPTQPPDPSSLWIVADLYFSQARLESRNLRKLPRFAIFFKHSRYTRKSFHEPAGPRACRSVLGTTCRPFSVGSQATNCMGTQTVQASPGMLSAECPPRSALGYWAVSAPLPRLGADTDYCSIHDCLELRMCRVA